jgi:opacity protein-like surface antigen
MMQVGGLIMRSKKFLAALAFGLAGPGLAAMAAMPTVASAADMPIKAPVMAPVGYDWSGGYVGVTLGGAWSSHSVNEYNDSLVALGHSSYKDSGIIGGGEGGYNWMVSPNWLMGVEIDLSGSSIKSDRSGCSANVCATSHGKLESFLTTRGRVGYAVNNWLFYGTGGWAWVDSSSERVITAAPGFPGLVGASASSGGVKSGWVAGGGIEWAFAQHWTAKVEYMHIGLSDVARDYVYPGFAGATRHFVSQNDIDLVRAGLNFKL